ncbi:MAG: hypothetical protein ACKOBN_03775 [Flavobacteriales bacterium]
MKKILLFVVGVLLMYACGSPENTKTFTLKDIEFKYEGPLFQGSNPSQYVAKIDLKEILGEDYKEGIQIEEAVLKNATVQSIDPKNFQDINALVLSLASDNPDLSMQELAVLNPIQAKQSTVKLRPSKEADPTDYFAEKQVYVILDASFAKDVNSNVTLKGSFEFEVKY